VINLVKVSGNEPLRSSDEPTLKKAAADRARAGQTPLSGRTGFQTLSDGDGL
jgi:hypothetical protein